MDPTRVDDLIEEAKSAADLRELATGYFTAAKELADAALKDGGEPEGDDATRFDALMAAGAKADGAFSKKAGFEGKVGTLRDRLSHYSAASGAGPIDWGRPAMVGGIQLKSLGQAFVESDEYAELKESGALDSDRAQFRTDPVRIDGGVEVKAPTDVIGSGAGPGGALITPQYLPGIIPLAQRPLTVRDLFSQGQTTSDTISYARQATFENSAAAVAQATSTPGSGAKPQSSISWTRVTRPVETIATWMAATRRQLADAGQTASLIDNQLRLMLMLEEEDQLLNGSGASPNLEGLLTIAGVQTLDLTAVADATANLDGIRTAKRLVRTGASRAVADAIVLNPLDSEEFDLMKDLEGRYRAGDPFGTGTEAPPIWRMRRVESEAVTAGLALVGAFRQGATVFEREGIAILTSDSHADFFVRNLVAVLAEERLGFAVFFPSAFVEVTLKAW